MYRSRLAAYRAMWRPFATFAFIGLLALIGCNPGLFFSPQNTAFVRASGRQLVVGPSNTPIVLKGINFANQYWQPTRSQLLDNPGHADVDFQRVADMGFNAIRFALSYLMFEDDANPSSYDEAGFQWLMGEIALAETAGLLLIIDMHVPQGGFQSTGDADGLVLWTDSQVQDRLVNLWAEIARRLKDNTTVAAYDIVNEPVPPNSKDEWRILAQRIIDRIRTIDPNHLIIVEAVGNVRNAPGSGDVPEKALVLVNDGNVMYDYHFYLPFTYTHQGADFGDGKPAIPEEGPYPDPNVTQFPEDVVFAQQGAATPSVPAGSPGWVEYVGSLEKITDATIIEGHAIFDSTNNSGRVYFDDFVINEYDANGTFIRQISSVNVTSQMGWSSLNDDPAATLEAVTTVGHTDTTSLSIAGHTANASWNHDEGSFPVVTGNQYQIKGWMKGSNVSAGAQVIMGIVFSRSASGLPAMPRGRGFLAMKLDQWLAFSATNNVPFHFGEFGTIDKTFQNAKGGEAYIQDMIELLKERGISFSLWAYQDDPFGIYISNDALPDPATNANQPLITAIKKGLGTTP